MIYNVMLEVFKKLFMIIISIIIAPIICAIGMCVLALLICCIPFMVLPVALAMYINLEVYLNNKDYEGLD